MTWLLPVERRPLTRDGSTKWQVSTGRDRRCAKVRKGRIGSRRAGVEEVTGFSWTMAVRKGQGRVKINDVKVNLKEYQGQRSAWQRIKKTFIPFSAKLITL